MKNKIKWEKWTHPLGGGPEYEGAGGETQMAPVRPVLLTSAGIVPCTVYGDMARQFRLWVGHTNFPVTGGVRGAVADVPGVESLDILTPYRFRLGVGLAFSQEVVKGDVEEACDAAPAGLALPEATRGNVEMLESVLRKRHPFWAVLVLPNLAMEHFHTGRPDEYRRRLRLYEAARELAGGVVLTCDD